MAPPPLLTCLRETEARVLRRLMKVRAARSGFAEDPAQWLKTQFEMEIGQIARESGIADMTAHFEDDGKDGAFYIHAAGGGEVQIYGPVLWHLACSRSWDVLSRRGVGYVLRHTDLL